MHLKNIRIKGLTKNKRNRKTMELNAIIEVNSSQNNTTTKKPVKVERDYSECKPGHFEAQFLEKTGLNFNEFYKKYYSKLVWKISQMNITSLDAEDIANRAFIQSLNKIEMYNPQYNFSTWLFDIAKKMAYQYKKDSSRMIAVDVMSEDSDSDEAYNPIQGYLIHKTADDYYHNLDNEVLLQKKYKATLKEISKLDPKYRTIIELCDIHGKTYNEICDALGVNLQTVKNSLHHGRMKLEKNLREHFDLLQENY